MVLENSTHRPVTTTTSSLEIKIHQNTSTLSAPKLKNMPHSRKKRQVDEVRRKTGKRNEKQRNEFPIPVQERHFHEFKRKTVQTQNHDYGTNPNSEVIPQSQQVYHQAWAAENQGYNQNLPNKMSEQNARNQWNQGRDQEHKWTEKVNQQQYVSNRHAQWARNEDQAFHSSYKQRDKQRSGKNRLKIYQHKKIIPNGPAALLPTHYYGKYAGDKKKYDEELLHMYNKLNDHFQHNHMRIARLDIIRADQEPTAFPPIYYRTTTLRSHIKKHWGPAPPPSTTTTTTTTTSTTPRPYMHPPLKANLPARPLKINAEVYMDESRFHKPVQVLVTGKKVDAKLYVYPKNPTSHSGDIVRFEENPIVSGQLHPVFDLSKRHFSGARPRLRHNYKPLNLRKYILYQKQSRDNLPHNVIDRALDSGIKSVTSFAKSILPSVFGEPEREKPMPKMHKFESLYASRGYNQPRPPIHIVEKPSVRKGKRLNAIDRGLEDLIRTDEEIPR